MSVSHGSSWNFQEFRLFHLRYVRATPHNSLRFGARPRAAFFHPSIRPLLHKIVLDPQQFAAYSIQGHCVPLAIVLTILVRLEGLRPSKLLKRQVNQGLGSLRYHQFLQQHPTPGICLENFSHLERANSPLPLRLVEAFPSLNGLKGLAINLFRATIHQEPNEQKPTIFLFPSLLSRHNTSNDYLQVDLLLDSPDLTGRKVETDSKFPPHVLVVTDLVSLLARNCPTKRHNAHRYIGVCRSCCMLFSCLEDLQIHRRYPPPLFSDVSFHLYKRPCPSVPIIPTPPNSCTHLQANSCSHLLANSWTHLLPNSWTRHLLANSF